MSGWDNKSELEKVIQVGITGIPRLKKAERSKYLGFFRERVIEAVTFQQIKSKKGIAAINKALKHGHAVELVIHSRARSDAMPCIILAQNKGIDFTITNDPEFTGEVGVIVIADKAVDVDLLMSDRDER